MVLGLLWSNIVFALPKCQGEDVYRWTMCKETYIFKNGDKYVGQFKDGKFHGKGTYIFKNENKYVGDFKNGKFHGKGTYIFTNGDKYVGEFKDGRKNDQVTTTYSAGEVTVYDCSNAPYNLSKYPGTCWGDAVWHCLHPNGQGAYDKIQSLPTAGTPGAEGKPYTDGGKQAYELYIKFCQIALQKEIEEEEKQRQKEEIMKPSLYEKIKEQRLKDAHEKLIKKKRKKDQKKQNEEQRLREEEQRLREEEQRLREETEQPKLSEEEQQKPNKLLPE